MKSPSFCPILRQYLVVIIVNLSMINVTIGMLWSSPVLVKLSDPKNTIIHRAITETEGSCLVSVTFVCGAIYMIPIAYLVDTIGRKYCVLAAVVPRIVGYVILIYANNVWMMIVARGMASISDGLVYTSVPLYASEVAHKDIRGALGSIMQISSSVGAVFMLCIGPFLDYEILNILALVVTIATVVPLLFLKDSPYFLFKQGRRKEAVQALTFLRGSESVAIEEIKDYDETNSETEISLREVLKSKAVRKALGITLTLGGGAAMTGYCVVAFYLQTILESTHSSMSSDKASLIVGIFQFIGSCIVVWIIDRFGRKVIIVMSLVGLALGTAGLASFYKIYDANHEVVEALNYLPLVSIILVVYCYCSGIGSVMLPLTAELFEGRMRAKGVASCVMMLTIVSFILTQCFSILWSSMGPVAMFYMFCGINLVLCLLVALWVPETKCRSFTEIQASLGGDLDSSNCDLKVL